jgi:3D (Asp-Asp-Asp) domain-containing protein
MISALIFGGLFFNGEAYTRQERVHVTAYNSLPNQTDSTPFRTSTGERVGNGVVAFSQNLIRKYGYGATVKINYFERSRGCNPALLKRKFFVVKDTTNPRFVNRMDIWFAKYRDAINFGKCNAMVTISPKR